MDVGKTLFAQVYGVMVPWWRCRRAHFGLRRSVSRNGLLATDLARVLARHQGWRPINSKLFHMGLRGAPARSTLADALNQRDWCIYHALALRLIVRARELYAKEPTGLELDATVYALGATTIDLRLSLFD